jgi:hypothetical protein
MLLVLDSKLLPSIYCSYCTPFIAATAHHLLQLLHTIYRSYCTPFIAATAHHLLQLLQTINCSYCTPLIAATAHHLSQLLHTIYCSYCRPFPTLAHISLKYFVAMLNSNASNVSPCCQTIHQATLDIVPLILTFA